MKLWEALKALEEGHSITRKGSECIWNKENLRGDSLAITHWQQDDWEVYIPPVTFEEARKKYKRFRRREWGKGTYLTFEYGNYRACYKGSRVYNFTPEDFDATDWEEYTEASWQEEAFGKKGTP